MSAYRGDLRHESKLCLPESDVVQYRIPAAKKGPALVLVHGSNHSGVTYETTPDGREGWATYFLRDVVRKRASLVRALVPRGRQRHQGHFISFSG